MSKNGYEKIPDVELGERVAIVPPTTSASSYANLPTDQGQLMANFDSAASLANNLKFQMPPVVDPSKMVSQGQSMIMAMMVPTLTALGTFAAGMQLNYEAKYSAFAAVLILWFPYMNAIVQFASSMKPLQARLYSSVETVFETRDQGAKRVQEGFDTITRIVDTRVDALQKEVGEVLEPLKPTLDQASAQAEPLKRLDPNIDIPDLSDIDREFDEAQGKVGARVNEAKNQVTSMDAYTPEPLQSADKFYWKVVFPIMLAVLSIQLAVACISVYSTQINQVTTTTVGRERALRASLPDGIVDAHDAVVAEKVGVAKDKTVVQQVTATAADEDSATSQVEEDEDSEQAKQEVDAAEEQVAGQVDAAKEQVAGLVDAAKKQVAEEATKVKVKVDMAEAQVEEQVDAAKEQVAGLVDTAKEQMTEEAAKLEAKFDAAEEQAAGQVGAAKAHVAGLFDAVKKHVVGLLDEAEEQVAEEAATVKAKVDVDEEQVAGQIDAAGEQVEGKIDATGEQVDAAGEHVAGQLDAAVEQMSGLVDSVKEQVTGLVDAAVEQVAAEAANLQVEVDAAEEQVEGQVDAAKEQVAGQVDVAKAEVKVNAAKAEVETKKSQVHAEAEGVETADEVKEAEIETQLETSKAEVDAKVAKAKYEAEGKIAEVEDPAKYEAEETIAQAKDLVTEADAQVAEAQSEAEETIAEAEDYATTVLVSVLLSYLISFIQISLVFLVTSPKVKTWVLNQMVAKATAEADRRLRATGVPDVLQDVLVVRMGRVRAKLYKVFTTVAQIKALLGNVEGVNQSLLKIPGGAEAAEKATAALSTFFK